MLAFPRMLGTILNAGTIVLGGVLGLALDKRLPSRIEFKIKMVLGVLTIWIGLKTTWQSINGSFGAIGKQILIVMAALVVGNALGKLLRLQKQLNKLGDYASRMFHKDEDAGRRRFGEGFVTCAILFCVGPMAIVGSLEDGLTGKFPTLAIKSAMDGLATMAFVKPFGIGPIFAAIPVLAYQGTITLGAKSMQPFLQKSELLESVNATGGLLILCISLVLLDIQKVPLADYLPALLVAPALTWFFS
jgi:uncharacterized membrane protein YqgA involved in biofilm formation